MRLRMDLPLTNERLPLMPEDFRGVCQGSVFVPRGPSGLEKGRSGCACPRSRSRFDRITLGCDPIPRKESPADLP
jgi:hypothetical protein